MNYRLFVVVLAWSAISIGCGQFAILPTETQYVPPSPLPSQTPYVSPPAIPPTATFPATATFTAIVTYPTSTRYIPSPIPPSATQFIPLPATPTMTPTKTPTNTPTWELTNPEGFARWYFTAVWQTRNYDYLWTFLTPSFRSHSSPNGYYEYANWWGSVDKVDISSINVFINDGRHASIITTLAFHLHNGQLMPYTQYAYDLVYNPDRHTWMFDYR